MPPNSAGAPAGPTGQLFSGSATDFLVSGVSFTGAEITNVPARFIVAGEGGTIAAWGESGSTPATRMQQLATLIDKGVAVSADSGSNNRVYAANFSAGKIEVYSADWLPVALPSTALTDSSGTIPTEYAPFNIQRVFNPVRGADSLFVAFAKIGDASAGEEEAGAGLGYLAEFDLDGNLLGVWQTDGKLNAPWGIAAAPLAGFGSFSGALLVGNFGDGASLGRDDSLYFSAGPEEESQGLFGRLSFAAAADVPAPPTILSLLGGMLALGVARRRIG